MTKEELKKKIHEVEEDIMYEECADIGYRFDVVADLHETLEELKAKLAELD